MRCRKIWHVILKTGQGPALGMLSFSKLREKSAQAGRGGQRAPGGRALGTKKINTHY